MKIEWKKNGYCKNEGCQMYDTEFDNNCKGLGETPYPNDQCPFYKAKK